MADKSVVIVNNLDVVQKVLICPKAAFTFATFVLIDDFLEPPVGSLRMHEHHVELQKAVIVEIPSTKSTLHLL